MKPVLPGGDSEAGSEAQRRGIAPEPIGLSNRRRPIGCVMGTGSAAMYKFVFDLTDGGNWLVDVHASS